MKKIVLSIVAVLVFGGFAVAGDDAGAALTGDEWSGFYVGVQAGYVSGSADLFSFDEGTPGYAIDDMSASGGVGGLYAGYNWPLGNNVVLGVVGEYNWTSADDSVSFDDGWWGADVNQDSDASLAFRAATVIGNYSPYVTIGIAWADVTVEGWNLSPVRDSHDLSLTGWTVGFGIERAMTENLRLRVQWRYSDYGDESWTIEDPNTDYGEGRGYYDATLLTVGLSYQF